MSTIRLRRGTLAQWNSVNPILKSGEPGVALNDNADPGWLKIGNGVDHWVDLPFENAAVMAAIVAEAGLRSAADSALGVRVTALEAGGVVPTADSLVLTKTAGSTLSGHVLVSPTSGTAVDLADPTDLAGIDLPIWMTIGAASVGTPASVLVFGPFVEPSWSWTPGSALYLGPSGTLTAVVPTAPGSVWLRKVATAISATAIQFDPSPPISIL